MGSGKSFYLIGGKTSSNAKITCNKRNMCKKIVTVIRKSEKDDRLHFFLISKDENTEKKH
jgi:hypothetical protein